MDEYVPTFVRALDLTGIFAFALSGGWLALRQKLDLVGVTALAVAAALFGGLVRDILIGQLPPQLVTDRLYLPIPLLAVVVVLALPHLSERRFRLVLVFDAIGLGMFAAIGASKAIVIGGLGLIGATFVGTVAAVGGGVIRDVLAAGVPQVFQGESELYVVPAIAGSLAAAIATENGVASLEVLLACAAGTAAIRLLAARYGWHAPVPAWVYRRRGE
ncbi:MAG TPA: TRIC cation channel family protein [Acidimicrobiia bacterium]